jgi:Icc protein
MSRSSTWATLITTSYNELANDGPTIFAATRSTGQIEEGPVGYALTSVDDGVVSWRFKLLDEPFPFVMITTPADYRLVRSPGQVVPASCEVRALVSKAVGSRASKLKSRTVRGSPCAGPTRIGGGGPRSMLLTGIVSC